MMYWSARMTPGLPQTDHVRGTRAAPQCQSAWDWTERRDPAIHRFRPMLLVRDDG